MALLNITSPHAHGPLSTANVMQWVLLATLPGIAVLAYTFGYGIIVNLIIASISALASEALVMAIRGRPISFYLSDFSALVTAVLLAISLPPYAPWWLVVIGSCFAIVVAKHLYGGLGYNPFNPAMAAYVVLLISLPVHMTSWGAPHADSFMGLGASMHHNLFGSVDAVTSATPLDALKLHLNAPIVGSFGGYGWEWANLAFLLGGLILLWKRIYSWHAPISMLLGLVVMAWLFPHVEQGRIESVVFHLFTGSTMFGAFFIITDPVSSATSQRGRMVFGAAIGVLLYSIRSWGNYPDAMAFAVLLLNLAAPFIDIYTQPRTFGHGGKTS
jgi:electron transport complex protein RnfD